MTTATKYRSGQFCWVDLTAHDLDEAAEFYEQLLDWSREPVELPEGSLAYAQFLHDGRPVAAVAQLSPKRISEDVPPTWNSYVYVDDVDAVVRQSTRLGATVNLPPRDAGELGRLAFIQDPTGAVVGLWQRRLPLDAEPVFAGSVYWNELQTRDGAAARRFYGSLFDWQFEELSSGGIACSQIRCGGVENGWLVQMDERWGTMPSRWAVYFAVDDTDFATDQLRQLGGMVFVPPLDYPFGRTAMVGDIQGAMFHLVQMKRLGPLASDTQLPESIDHAGDDAG